MQLLDRPAQLSFSSVEHPIQSGIHRTNSQNNIGETQRVIVQNRYHLSPEYKRSNSPLENARLSGFMSPDKWKSSKQDILFTIEQNHYNRKNSNQMNPCPPKYRVYTKRQSFDQESENSTSSRQRKVIFTDRLITDKPPLNKKEKEGRGPIIRNGSLNNKNSLDNSSQKSVSVQNSFVSQMRTSSISLKEQKPRIDTNKQKYYQIKSYFQSGKQNKNEYGLKNARQTKKDDKEKYTDSIFPPVYSSLYLGVKNKSNPQQLTWKRLGDYTSNMSAFVLPPQGQCDLAIELDQAEPSFCYIIIAFNALKHCGCVLERIFDDQGFNEQGLYLLKIFQQNNWKSIIMDDYIPFRQKSQVPAFVNVRSNGKWIEIWPFLLLKAFANYYSTYQALMTGNLIDFLSETTGLAPLQLTQKKKPQKQLTKLRKHLQVKDSFAIAEILSQVPKYLIIRSASLNNKRFLFYSEYPTFRQVELEKPIFEKIKKLYVYNPRVYNTLSTATIGWYGANNKSQDRTQYSLRKLIIYEQTQCLISIQQKEARFYSKSSLKYNYMWVRMILVQRQYNGYRWIRGKYKNSKSNVLSATLTPGQYYLIIMPQWKKSHNFELNLLVWANHLVKIQREKANSCQEMLQQACMDLAQRNGTISQLRPSLCSYNYICGQTGLIIENINNEKLKEEIKIHRKISGIPCSVDLVPVNKAFWVDKQKFKQELNIQIPKASAYTLVLRMRGGIDYKLVRLFSKDRDK